MRTIIKLIFFFILGVGLFTLYGNYRAGNPWTVASLKSELQVTLGLVKVQSGQISQGASRESGRVMGVMTSRMVEEPIAKAITGTLSDEVQAIPYNICKPIVTNFENKQLAK